MTRNARILLLALAAVVAVGAFVVIGTGDDDDSPGTTAATTTTPRTGPATTATRSAPPPVPVVALRDGRPVGGVKELEFESGRRARFAVTSNAAAEVHVHGYDITRDVPAGGRTTISFRANLEGVYEIESHDTGEQVATLRVVP